jgi:predicted  nucleic acid-binding Zn-ribbon protein
LRLKLVVFTLLSLFLLGGSCATSPDFDSSLKSIVKPYQFSIAQWEFKALPNEVNDYVFNKGERAEDKVGAVVEYFNLIEQIKSLEAEIAAVNAGYKADDLASLESELDRLQQQKAALTDGVEKIIAEQIREVLAAQGIYHPLDNYIKWKVGFPPLIFRLEPPPHLLVVSPRDRIESLKEIHLQQDLSVQAMENIEEQVDGLGVSSLVEGLGGLGTYPSFVMDDASLHFTIETATHEWLHSYLAFKPLGFLYILDLTGISPNYDIATMNETVVGIVSKEIGTTVCQAYYPGYENSHQQPAEEPEFDFNQEMREIRQTVDTYLAQGEIGQAEEYMEQKRQYLASMGYYIRKLNQAYFAFHGTYADSPTSISPIGAELKQLREQSASVKDFLDTVAVMTSRQDLSLSIQ